MQKLINKFAGDPSMKNAQAIVKHAEKRPMPVVSLDWESIELYNQARAACGK